MVRWRADKDQSQEALAIPGFIEVQFEVTVTKFTICIIKIFIPYFVDALGWQMTSHMSRPVRGLSKFQSLIEISSGNPSP